MADYSGSLAAEGVPFETLDAAETMRRWPQWRLADDTVTIFQAAGGLADPNRANAAHQRLAREHGATLLDRTPVSGLRDAGRRDRDRDRRAAARSGPARWSWRPTPGPTSCSLRSTGGCR